MCSAPRMPKPQPVQLPPPVAPIEQAELQVPSTPPPAPEKTATYFGIPRIRRTTASSAGGSNTSSLRIRRQGGRSYSSLNVPNA